jgi:serine/threonine-protein kinase RsbW
MMAVYPAKKESFEKINRQVVQAARQAGLSDDATYDVELAIDEACANIVDHSYGGDESGEIECDCLILPDGLKVILHDSGCFFNPEQIAQPNIKVPLLKRKPGGLGLFFMRKLMDEVTFDPCSSSQGTILTMVKRKG